MQAHERKTVVMACSSSFALSNWKNGAAIFRLRMTEDDFIMKSRIVLDILFEMPIRMQVYFMCL